ncbi:hypothetical protein WN51_14117 [Melipona quadrifasciata]|uniref:Uncharacterized protein n=1 Tax=Melipona quadrifasciata TaxID=166423 RepID=A0A0M8ZZE7_9HYME|nr:hypothetical protein WN51_14117 [Melipona quadrifasciata]
MANGVKVRWKTVPNEPIAAIGSRIPLKVGTATWLLPLMLVHPRISGPVSYVYPSVYMHQHARSDSPGHVKCSSANRRDGVRNFRPDRNTKTNVDEVLSADEGTASANHLGTNMNEEDPRDRSWDRNGSFKVKEEAFRFSGTKLNELNDRTDRLARRNNRTKDARASKETRGTRLPMSTRRRNEGRKEGKKEGRKEGRKEGKKKVTEKWREKHESMLKEESWFLQHGLGASKGFNEEERGKIEGKRVGGRWTKGAGSHSAAISGHVIRIKPATRVFLRLDVRIRVPVKRQTADSGIRCSAVFGCSSRKGTFSIFFIDRGEGGTNGIGIMREREKKGGCVYIGCVSSRSLYCLDSTSGGADGSDSTADACAVATN